MSYLIMVIFFINSEVWFENKDLKQTKGLMSASVVQHVRFKILYIS